MQIEALNRPGRGERDRQPQLCVPPITINGPSWRLKDKLTNPTTAATTAAVQH